MDGACYSGSQLLAVNGKWLVGSRRCCWSGGPAVAVRGERGRRGDAGRHVELGEQDAAGDEVECLCHGRSEGRRLDATLPGFCSSANWQIHVSL